MATKAGLLFAGELGLRQVYLEVDAKQVINRIKSIKEDLSYNGSILAHILMYSPWFDRFDCGSMIRDANSVVDSLVKQAKLGSCGTWINNPPNSIISLLIADSCFE